MYAQAFAEDPSLGEDLAQGHRYNAACAAPLADAAKWRRRALEWLHADLAALEKAATGPAAALEEWKRDSDLAVVREYLDRLPQPESEA